MKQIFKGTIGKSEITYSFQYPKTSLYFHQFLRKTDETEDDPVTVTESDFCWACSEWKMEKNSYLEFSLSMFRTSDYLTKNNSCLFHGAAFLWNGKAYLLSGDSGIGKTTQLKNWMKLYSHEIQIINGDKPVLCMEDGKQITVYPSPWKGKEGFGDDSLTAPLGGIILLKQGKENSIKKVSSLHYSARLLSYFFSTFEDENTVRILCEIESVIWETVPVWQLTNTGDSESAQISHQAIQEEMNNEV